MSNVNLIWAQLEDSDGIFLGVSPVEVRKNDVVVIDMGGSKMRALSISDSLNVEENGKTYKFITEVVSLRKVTMVYSNVS